MKTRAKIKSIMQDALMKIGILILEIPRQHLQELIELKDVEVSVEIKRFLPRRSRSANAYAWVLIDELAEKLNLTKTEVYRHAIRDIGGVSDTVCVPDKAVDRLCEGWMAKGLGWQTERLESKLRGCTNVVLYYGSSTYDSRQMHALIDTLIAECKQQGIETLTPAQLVFEEENG